MAGLLGVIAFFAFAWIFGTRPFWTGPKLRDGPADGDGGFEGVVVDAAPVLRGPVSDVECAAWWLWERGSGDDPPWVPTIRTWTDRMDVRLSNGRVVRVRTDGVLMVQGGREIRGLLTDAGKAACAAAKHGGNDAPPAEAREESIPLGEVVFLAGGLKKNAAIPDDPMRREAVGDVETWVLSNSSRGDIALVHLGARRDFRWGGPMWRRRHRLPALIGVSTLVIYLMLVWSA